MIFKIEDSQIKKFSIGRSSLKKDEMFFPASWGSEEVKKYILKYFAEDLSKYSINIENPDSEFELYELTNNENSMEMWD